MTKSTDYYFSTPVKSEEGSVARPTVIVTSKSIWDARHELDYYILGSEYTELYCVLNVPGQMAEAMENFFQPQKPLTCEELKAHLEQKGFVHNPGLDGLMQDFLDLSA